jgi:hypothetical protein
MDGSALVSGVCGVYDGSAESRPITTVFGKDQKRVPHEEIQDCIGNGKNQDKRAGRGGRIADLIHAFETKPEVFDPGVDRNFRRRQAMSSINGGGEKGGLR